MALPQSEGRFDAAAYLAWEESQPGRNDESHWVLYEYGAGDTLELVSSSVTLTVAEILDETPVAAAPISRTEKGLCRSAASCAKTAPPPTRTPFAR